jgi:hypothetical protein
VFSLPRLQAETIRELAWGRDESEVKMSGRTASIGLEDRQVYSSVARSDLKNLGYFMRFQPFLNKKEQWNLFYISFAQNAQIYGSVKLFYGTVYFFSLDNSFGSP